MQRPDWVHTNHYVLDLSNKLSPWNGWETSLWWHLNDLISVRNNLWTNESYLVTKAMCQSDHWVMWPSLACWSASSGDAEGGGSWLKETNLHCNYTVVGVNRFVPPKSLPVAMVCKVGTTPTTVMSSFSGKLPIQQPNWCKNGSKINNPAVKDSPTCTLPYLWRYSDWDNSSALSDAFLCFCVHFIWIEMKQGCKFQGL